jgi:hypothetical protein
MRWTKHLLLAMLALVAAVIVAPGAVTQALADPPQSKLP